MITLITKDQADLIRDSGHNSPGDVAGSKWPPFAKEFGDIRDAFAACLSGRYRLGRYPSCDIFLVDDIFPTRVLYLEILSLRPLEPAFLELLVSFLQSRKEDYRIAVCDAECFLRHSDGSPYPSFYLAITKSSQCIYAESTETLDRFGIAKKA